MARIRGLSITRPALRGRYADETASDDIGNSTEIEEYPKYGTSSSTNAAYKGFKTFPEGEHLVDRSPLSQKKIGYGRLHK